LRYLQASVAKNGVVHTLLRKWKYSCAESADAAVRISLRTGQGRCRMTSFLFNLDQTDEDILQPNTRFFIEPSAIVW
jgi:hypothetical protein